MSTDIPNEPSPSVADDEPTTPAADPVDDTAPGQQSGAVEQAPAAGVQEPVEQAPAAGEPEPVEQESAVGEQERAEDESSVVEQGSAAGETTTSTETSDAQGEEPAQPASAVPEPATPRPPVPSPAALAARIGTARPAAPVVADHSESARFGRVAEDGTVFVRSGTEEVPVGSYPGASPDEALQYFARKYDELHGMAELLQQRLSGPGELTAKDAAEQLAHLQSQADEPTFVGDLDALRGRLDAISALIETRREEEAAERAAAKAAALQEREALVERAEAIAAQDPQRTQWKRSGEELRGLFEQWKSHQRSGPRLDKPVEAGLWTRFSAARSTFDKARRVHFAELDAVQAEAKAVKERLVREAEKLATSRDWGPTAREFKRLMDRWRAAGRAGRADDDALWERFKAAQDSFFTAKDEVAAAEDQQFRANLAVKEELLVEAEALLPVRDLEAAKTALRSIQDRWDKAGKVPRADIDRTEKAMRRVEQAVRDAEERKWSSSNPEARARAQSLVDQLERAVADMERELERAEQAGNVRKAADVRSAIAGRQALLDQARSALTEFS